MNNLMDMDRLIGILNADPDGLDAAYNALSPEMRAYLDTGDPTHLAAYNSKCGIDLEQAGSMGDLATALTTIATAIATPNPLDGA